MSVTGAAVLYFLLVFGVGFLLGPIRVLFLEPRLGPVAAVLCEAPLLLLAIYLAARWVPRLWRRDIRAGHWSPMSHPQEVATAVDELVSHLDGAPASPALSRARVVRSLA